jgi:hypothetical protein
VDLVPVEKQEALSAVHAEVPPPIAPRRAHPDAHVEYADYAEDKRPRRSRPYENKADPRGSRDDMPRSHDNAYATQAHDSMHELRRRET